MYGPLTKQEHHRLMQERRRKKFATEMIQKEDRHSQAVERHLREEMRRGLPKCGHPTRSGEPCPNPKPRAVHELAPGMRWCQSTLDKNPCEGCRMQCPADKQYCEYHVAAQFKRVAAGRMDLAGSSGVLGRGAAGLGGGPARQKMLNPSAQFSGSPRPTGVRGAAGRRRAGVGGQRD